MELNSIILIKRLFPIIAIIHNLMIDSIILLDYIVNKCAHIPILITLIIFISEFVAIFFKGI